MTTTPPVNNPTTEPVPDHNTEPVRWRTSSYSNGQGACIQTAHLAAVVAIRDSKNPLDHATLTLPPTAWATFIAHTQHHRFTA